MRFSFEVRSTALLAVLCLGAHAQTPTPAVPVSESKGMTPRAAPTDYQAQVKAGTMTIAAEFKGHAVPTPEQTLTSEDFVVVEIACFGPPEARLVLATGDFSLRINGKKTPLSSEPFELVSKSVKDPEWQPPEQPGGEPKSKGGLSTGGKDPNAMPVIIHVPIELRRAMAQHVVKASLPQGDRALPVAGLIYFQFRGQAKSIHSIELIYSGPAGTATIPLQP